MIVTYNCRVMFIFLFFSVSMLLLFLAVSRLYNRSIPIRRFQFVEHKEEQGVHDKLHPEVCCPALSFA